MRLALSPARPDRKTGDQRLRRRRKPNYPCCFLQPGPERSFSEGCACVSSAQRGSGDARGAKNSLTWAPGAGGEGRGWGMAWDAEAELATPCCPCEPGPVHLSPSQSIPVHPSPSQLPAEVSRRIQAGCRGSWTRCISTQRLLLLCSLEVRGSSAVSCSPSAGSEHVGAQLPGTRAGRGAFAACDSGGGRRLCTWLSRSSEVGRHPEDRKEVVRNEVILCELLSKT